MDTRQAQFLAFALAALLTLVISAVEVAVTGRSEPFSTYSGLMSIAWIAAIYFWYHLDKRERGFPAGLLQNLAVIVVPLIGLPVYLLRSRGWKQGPIAIAVAAAVVLALGVVGVLGERVGALLAG